MRLLGCSCLRITRSSLIRAASFSYADIAFEMSTKA